jgi:hypothetical protein
MIQISETGERDDDCNAALAVYVVTRLPDDYRITEQDIKWLDVCGDYLEGKPTNESVLAATKKAFEIHQHAFYIDPFELLIDANICDTKCEPK